MRRGRKIAMARKLAVELYWIWRFMYVDSRYPIRHNVSSWRERRACCEFLNQGHRLSPLPKDGRDNAQLFTQPRTLRIRQKTSVNFSTVRSISPLLACPILHSTRTD